MKLKVVLFSLALSLSFACSSDSNETTSINAVTANSVATLTIEGMECQANCANSIQDELNGTNGIASANVNFENKSATVNFDNTKISQNEIEVIIEALKNEQFEAEFTSMKSSKNNSKVISSGGDNDVDANSFSFEVPNFFSVLKNIL